MPSKPVALLEMSYEDPTATPVWVDESAYLRGFSTNRGKQTETDRQEAGRCTLTLDNRVGRFDPGNTAGAHYPYVLPMRRVRLSTSLNATVPETFTMRSSNVGSTAALRAGDGVMQLFIFTGFIESISQTWMLANGDAAVSIQCVDGFKVLNTSTAVWGLRWDSTTGGDPFPTIYCGTSTGDVVTDGNPYLAGALQQQFGLGGFKTGNEIDLVLDCIDWIEGSILDSGTVVVWHANGASQNIPINENALTHILETADTEGGLFFMNTEGLARFIDKNGLTVPSVVTEIYGGQTGEIGYLDAVVEYDDNRLWNDVTVSAGDQVASSEDATSIASYFRRPLAVTTLEMGVPTGNGPYFQGAQDRADELLAKYKDPHIRITSLTLSPSTSANWLSVLSHDLGDYIRVKKRPATADEIDQTLRIEGIAVSTGSFDLDNWTVVFKTSS